MINNVEEIKGKISLLDLVNENVMTKKRGMEYVGLCPFHQENSPSFSVDTEKNVFYCFGCQEGGDVFNYYQKLNNVSFTESVQQLAEKYNLEVDQKQTERQKAIANEQEKSYKLTGWVNKQFENQLNEKAKDYLKKRGVSLSTAKIFGIGYGGFAKIEDKETARKLDILRGDRLTYQDRLIIPIRNKNGLVIAFNARTLTNQEPKYIHSPNSVLWNKKEVLFGLDNAIPLIKKQDKVYIVEGCFDAILAWQNNIPAVACLGSAISKKQLTELLKYTENIVFCLDQDKTGQKAIFKVIELVEIEIFSGFFAPKVLLLSGKDVAEYFESNSRENFLNLIEMEWVEWLFRYLIKTDKSHYNEILKYLAKFETGGEKQKYIKVASELLDGDTVFLQRELSRALHKPLVEKKIVEIKHVKKENNISFMEYQKKYQKKLERKNNYVNRT